jgi:hypothetical protein
MRIERVPPESRFESGKPPHLLTFGAIAILAKNRGSAKNIGGVVAQAFLGTLFLLSWVWQG